ncbi:MAG TPA: GGDEF domain-containing protein [Gemmatimonadales bacterium]|nr:GGDEF domain-containing protein [Gemmatimonadales bacterium]
MTPELPRATDLLPWWRRLWTTADPVMIDAGAGGELIVARVRLCLIGGLFVIPLVNYIQNRSATENQVGLGIGLMAVAVAGVILLSIKRNMYRPWLGFITSAIDVSLVSAGLAAFLVLDLPHTAVNSKVLFPVYFLAMFATSIRYDARVCITTGVLMLLEYAAIVWVAATHWSLNDPAYAPFTYGMFSWSAQIGRLVILLAAAVLATVVVVRTQRLRQLSTSDRLTGLFNRGYFEARLGAELSRARRGGSPLSLVMLDVDHFKRFNDRFGHLAGDMALRTIANLMRHALRRSDIIARFGGEEFVLVFPETEPDAVLEKLESIREAVASATIRLHRNQPIGGITVSAGIASFPHDSADAESLIDAADARLFRAKEGGRNRIVGPTAAAALPDLPESPAPRPRSSSPFSWRRRSPS